MEGFLYDDIENNQNTVTRLSLTEESINRTLLDGREKKACLCRHCLTYIIACCIIFMVMIVVIIIVNVFF
jgi:hypothetical protein